jgi:hypothetical protein
MVECAFSDPARESAWNDYYTQRKIDEVLAVPGFRTSQRFKALAPVASPYLAIHSVDSLEVLTGEAYRGGGGGHFDASFQSCILNWHRNLFDGLDRAPPVPAGSLLAVADCEPQEIGAASAQFTWLDCAGLDRSVPRRGIAVVTPARAAELAASCAGRVVTYAPLFAQRVEPAGKYAQQDEGGRR